MNITDFKFRYSSYFLLLTKNLVDFENKVWIVLIKYITFAEYYFSTIKHLIIIHIYFRTSKLHFNINLNQLYKFKITKLEIEIKLIFNNI